MEKYVFYDAKYDALTDEENALLDVVVDGIYRTVSHLDTLNGRKTRNFHAKTHAGIVGTLETKATGTFLDDLNPFPAPTAHVLARFSNAESVIVDDKLSLPAFGFALKISQGKEIVANIPLVNFPIFPSNSPLDVLKVVKAVNERTRQQEKDETSVMKTLDVLRQFSSLAFNSGFLPMLNVMQKGLQLKKDFVLNYTFHSVGCYRFSNAVCKFRVVPNKKFAIQDAADRVQQEMVQEILRTEDIEFDVQVQVCQDEARQPINELLHEWPVDSFSSIGKLTFPTQEIITSGNMELEKTSFSPFENSATLLPVGGIQQLRHKAYDASFAARTRG